MSGWQKRDEQNDEQNGLSQNGHGAAGTRPLPPAVLAFSASAAPPLQFCPECGQRLTASSAYVPKFCTHCGHRLPAPAAPQASGLDALLEATAAAKTNGAAAARPADGPDPNATLMGASRTLMGASRSDLYAASAHTAPTRSTRARIQEARRAGGKTTLTRSLPVPAPPSVSAPAPAPPLPAPHPPPMPEPRPSSWERSFLTFSVLLLLAVLAAAGAFWLARHGWLTLPFKW